VDRGYKEPFGSNLGMSSETELSEANGLFDLADNWFNDNLA